MVPLKEHEITLMISNSDPRNLTRKLITPLNNPIFWHMRSCSVTEVYEHFVEKYCLNFHGETSQASNQQEVSNSQS
jgi:hypothetical protein